MVQFVLALLLTQFQPKDQTPNKELQQQLAARLQGSGGRAFQHEDRHFW